MANRNRLVEQNGCIWKTKIMSKSSWLRYGSLQGSTPPLVLQQDHDLDFNNLLEGGGGGGAITFASLLTIIFSRAPLASQQFRNTGTNIFLNGFQNIWKTMTKMGEKQGHAHQQHTLVLHAFCSFSAKKEQSDEHKECMCFFLLLCGTKR